MTIAQSQPYVPLEDFLELEPEPGTWLEWCAGLVHAMSGGSIEHGRLSSRMNALLGAFGDPCTSFDATANIWVEAAQFFGQADVSLVCGPIRSFTVTRKSKTLGEAITNPVVIVELLSPSTDARDRGEKFAAYKQITSLREYVLISQDQNHVELRRRGDEGWSVETATAGQSVVIHGMAIAIDDIYR